MHVDIWSPGIIETDDGNEGYLMNWMCDLTQFIISSVTHFTDAATLAHIFMSDVVSIFGMFCVVMIDDGSTFKHVFIDMCNAILQ